MTCNPIDYISYDPINVDESDPRLYLRDIDRTLERFARAYNNLVCHTIDLEGMTDGASGDSEVNDSGITLYPGQIIGKDAAKQWALSNPGSVRPFMVVQDLVIPGGSISWRVTGPSAIQIESGVPAVGDILYASTSTNGKATLTRPSGSWDEVWYVGLVWNDLQNADGTYDILLHISHIPDISG